MFSCFDVKVAFCFAVVIIVAAITLKTVSNTRVEFFQEAHLKIENG